MALSVDGEEGIVQLSPDGTGKKIRNLVLYSVQPDGTTQKVYMQVTAIADKEGKIYDFQDLYDRLDGCLSELKMIRKILAVQNNSKYIFKE